MAFGGFWLQGLNGISCPNITASGTAYIDFICAGRKRPSSKTSSKSQPSPWIKTTSRSSMAAISRFIKMLVTTLQPMKSKALARPREVATPRSMLSPTELENFWTSFWFQATTVSKNPQWKPLEISGTKSFWLTKAMIVMNFVQRSAKGVQCLISLVERIASELFSISKKWENGDTWLKTTSAVWKGTAELALATTGYQKRSNRLFSSHPYGIGSLDQFVHKA